MEAMYDSTHLHPEYREPTDPRNPRPFARELEAMPPGSLLASYMATVDPSALTGYDRVLSLRATQRLRNHFDAMYLRHVAALADSFHEPGGRPEEDTDALEAEMRAALNLTRRAAEGDIELALSLRYRLPKVLAALDRGDLDIRQARAVHSSTMHLDDDLARSVVDQVMADAPDLTSGELRARIGKLAMTAEPDEAKKRMEEAHEDRCVVVESNPSGTANLHIMDLLPHQANAVKNRLIHTSRNTRKKGDGRTSDQIQADVALDLLRGSLDDGSAPSRGSQLAGGVTIKVDLKTLAELDDAPGELAGYGPVISDIARQVAVDQRDTRWTYVATDPDTGIAVSSGVTRRRPSTALRRMIEAKLQTCVFPGCRMPATASDIDHTKPWDARGLTDEANLAPLCRHDHGIKTRTGWTYQVIDGQVVWTSPLGHTYRKIGPPP